MQSTILHIGRERNGECEREITMYDTAIASSHAYQRCLASCQITTGGTRPGDLSLLFPGEKATTMRYPYYISFNVILLQ